MKDLSKNSVRLITNPVLLFCGVSNILLLICICMWMMVRLLGIATTEAEKNSVYIVIGLLVLWCLGAGLLCLPRWLVIITLTDSTVEYKAAFKKATKKPYSRYLYISRAWYMHRGIIPVGYKANFIVLSEGKLTEDEIQHINRVRISDSVIKIRYRRKTYDKLCAILPDKQRRRLERYFEEMSISQVPEQEE